MLIRPEYDKLVKKCRKFCREALEKIREKRGFCSKKSKFKLI
jgi:hypothetical protein